MLCILSCKEVTSQSGGGLEHYLYLSKESLAVLVPVAHYQFSGDWYGEARYNYEEANTFSLYGGKTFAKEGKWGYSATPMVGAITGLMNGGSLGLNLDLNRQKLFLSSQSQYSFSIENHAQKYFMTWSELGYEAFSWCYSGVAVQQRKQYRKDPELETGYMIGFSFGKWVFPLYVFSPSKKEKYFVAGINYEWEKSSGKKKK